MIQYLLIAFFFIQIEMKKVVEFTTGSGYHLNDYAIEHPKLFPEIE